jgi:hypothetical protein
VPVLLPPLALVVCLAAACDRLPSTETLSTPASHRISPPSTVVTTAVAGRPPSRWVGARIRNGAIEVSVAETGAKPRPLAVERPGSRSASRQVTDVAYDTRRELVYVATCCEPVSGHLWVLDAKAAGSGFAQGDQGFAVDVGGPASAIARTDTFGTLGLRASSGGEQELRADAGVADVAVDGGGILRVVALVDSNRLRALVPTVTAHDHALLVLQPKGDAAWTDVSYPLPRDVTHCRVVPLKEGAVGLLAGAVDPRDAVQCTGDRLDAYDTAQRRLRTGVLIFRARVRHLSIDDSSTFLIFTTVGGAVGWRTLDGRGGSLAAEGFAAADW